MNQARVTIVAFEVLVEADPTDRTSSLTLEVLHSVQEGAPPPPPAGRRGAVVIVMT